jgi:hypothetical protein
MKMTMPQIVMLNHAAWFNGKRTEARVKKDDAQSVQTDGPPDFASMTPEQKDAYYRSML